MELINNQMQLYVGYFDNTIIKMLTNTSSLLKINKLQPCVPISIQEDRTLSKYICHVLP